MDRTATTADGIEVTLSDGTVEHGDLLVGADGIHSHTRRMLFGDGFENYIATTQHFAHGLPPVVHSFVSTGKMVNLCPVATGTVSAIVYAGAAAGIPPRDTLRDYLLRTCAEFPAEVRRVFTTMTAGDFVFADAITQVDMPHFTGARSALIGDAAHCPPFLSGMGSSLALQDAHVLAGSLARSPENITAALRQFEAVMTPRPSLSRQRTRLSSPQAASRHRFAISGFASSPMDCSNAESGGFSTLNVRCRLNLGRAAGDGCRAQPCGRGKPSKLHTAHPTSEPAVA
ncbi:FAD-dependent monooxygenase [Kibdelosporangium philippinense]|uniref:FAD-dependent monooxygenase n=1 Tax=Kibdelosporangium philippinense TaxID=211113 RepID=A0ABS8Z358_9PSEU|nr:FAD-dependent monooxygenase [Kibdelosporangium philippinense]